MSLVLNIARDDFLNGLASVQNITSKKGTMAILSNVLIQSENDAVILTATDLEIGIKKKLPAEILSSGSITLPARKLFEIVRESNSDQIHMEILENCWAKITDDSSNYRLAGMDSEEFPSFPEYQEDMLVPVPGEILHDLISKTIFSVAQDSESQFTLTAILVEKEKKDGKNFLTFVSSDGHRLSLMAREVETDLEKLQVDKTTLIPRKGMAEIKKLCEEGEVDIFFGVEEKQAIFKTDNTLYIISLMQGDFPEFKDIIRIIDREKYFYINRINLMNSVKRMNLFTEDKYNIITFQIEKKNFTLFSQSMDLGDAREDIGIEFSGDSLLMGFNGKFFVDTLQIMKSDQVKIFISSQDSPCLIESEEDPDFVSIIMPMHIKNQKITEAE